MSLWQWIDKKSSRGYEPGFPEVPEVITEAGLCPERKKKFTAWKIHNKWKFSTQRWADLFISCMTDGFKVRGRKVQYCLSPQCGAVYCSNWADRKWLSHWRPYCLFPYRRQKADTYSWRLRHWHAHTKPHEFKFSLIYTCTSRSPTMLTPPHPPITQTTSSTSSQL